MSVSSHFQTHALQQIATMFDAPVEELSTAPIHCLLALVRLRRSMELSNVPIGRSLSVRTSPGGWRRPERLLEGAGKSGLGTVTDQVGNLRKGRAGIAELLGRDLHAPTGDVVHRRPADQTNEAVGQRRTRQADLAAQGSHGPRP